MKRKNILFILLFLCVLISCGGNNVPGANVPDNPGTGGKTPDPTPVVTEKGTVSFKNQSDYDVNVYYSLSPYYGSPCVTVPAKGTKDYTFIPSNDSLGDVFWFEYLIKIGNATFPYCTQEAASGYKYIKLSVNEKKTLEIDELLKCASKSAYFLLENNTTSNIRLMNSSIPMHEAASSNVVLDSGKSAVYEIGPSKTEATLGNVVLVKIRVDTKDIPLPVSNSEVVAGNIYTITVNNNSEGSAEASLKAISPFDVDTQKKMWSFDEKEFLFDAEEGISPVFRSANSLQKGSIVMGTVKVNTAAVNVLYIDQKMNVTKHTPFSIKTAEGEPKVDTLVVFDFVQQSDSSIVMLLRAYLEDGDWQDWLVAYDFDKGTALWSYSFTHQNDNPMVFRIDSSNKLVLLEDNKVLLVGAEIYYLNADSEVYVPYAAVFEPQDKQPDGSYAKMTFKKWNPTEGAEGQKTIQYYQNESLLSSAYYDGTYIYACGYTNCDFAYNSIEHTGVVYKFKPDFSEWELVYSQPRCLFFTISGTGNKWYTCGEYWKKTDGKLFGCYVSSSMVNKDKETFPTLYAVSNKHSWFTQLCAYDNMIVLCGISSNDSAGSDTPKPFVVSYDSAGKLRWENHSYDKWARAINIIPNAIGTYILQLTDSYNTKIHYVSADLLGKEIQ